MTLVYRSNEEVRELMPELCALVAEGKTVRQVAKHFGVSAGTILRWVGIDEKHTEQYTRAREAASDLFENDIIEAAMSVIPETAAADRVKIDALKWVAARRSPKKYGDRITQDHTSTDGSMVQQPTRIVLAGPSERSQD